MRDGNKCVTPNDVRTHHQLSGVKIVSESEKQGEGRGEVSGPGMRERGLPADTPNCLE